MEANMTTLRTGALVSLTATIGLVLALGGCAGAPSRTSLDGPSPSEAAPLTIRFENFASEYVHVYLIGNQRQWLLGRVEAGATAKLRLPHESFAADAGFLQLAVLTGERVTLQAAKNPRVNLTMAQPATMILSQPWRFEQGHVTSPGIRTLRAEPWP
jgi:hypothetical protein